MSREKEELANRKKVSLDLNMWSYIDYFRKRNLNNQLGIENTSGQEKLTEIHINIASSASFLIGGIIPVLPFESPIIPFVSITFPFWVMLLW
ncbi:MAG: hypothetical protein ACR5KX_01375 [Wolbachia sp.]